ncbi:MAG: bifunctional glutamate N-acetyltransferase/amino-acid acetyltransferase ArgJ [Planctomycetota bacterium]
MHRTPLAANPPRLPPRLPEGFRAATGRVGIRSGPGDDLALVVADAAASAAAVFTTNRFAAAPIELSRRHLAAAGGRCRGLVVNAGNANAATGAAGHEDARRTVEVLAAAIDAAPCEVLVNSTGVIGRRLPIDDLCAAIPRLAAALDGNAAAELARAIMTTDTAPKGAERRVPAADGGEISIVGICKGAGMIRPDMATMIGIVTTDASIDPAGLDALLRSACDRSFNRLSIDGDTSTNDAVFAMASGARGTPADPAEFARAFECLCLDLARMIAADGEGAQRVVEVHVRGAATPQDAREVAETVGGSLLVRTAIAGGDPNWGRIVAALGRTRATFDPDGIRIAVNDLPLFADGAPANTALDVLAAAFRAPRVELTIDLATGSCEDRFLTCDLTAEYVRINADYTT